MTYRLTDRDIAVVKLARSLGYYYETIAAYFTVNAGRVGEVLSGELGPKVRAADQLPADFPPLPIGGRPAYSRRPRPKRGQGDLFE